ncbi:MAG: hypothetical protein HPY71_07775 [Firmicutes bacterium]|nr:hypothetical protein [Bacillota bacterium]
MGVKGIKVGPGGLQIDDEYMCLCSGAMDYWRIERGLWGDILDSIAAMGFRMISTSIPWSVHEVKRGEFDFGGNDSRKDIDAFLSLAEGKGFKILIKPGPHVRGELTFRGYPERVILDPECQAQAASGVVAILNDPPKQFPVPSYASDKFYMEVGVWFDVLAPIIRRHIHPDGGVIGIWIDNEMSYLSRYSTYDLDYCPASINLYRQFLLEKYGGRGNLESHGGPYSSFEKIRPPVDFAPGSKKDIPYYLDWAEYKEYYLLYGLKRIAQLWRDRGIGGDGRVALMHNYPVALARTPFNIPAAEGVLDIQGAGVYPLRENYWAIREQAIFAAETSRLPFAAQFSSGIRAWADRPPLVEDVRFIAQACLMHGLKAFDFHMIVERERWTGSPIARDNRIRRELFDFYTKFNGILQDPDLALAGLRRRCDILLLGAREYDRLEASAQLLCLPRGYMGAWDELPVEELVAGESMDFRDVIQVENKNWWKAYYEAMVLFKHAFGLGDTAMLLEGAPGERLRGYRAIITPTFDFLGGTVQAGLLDYVQHGGALVIGPRIPWLNERMEEYRGYADILPGPVRFAGDVEVDGCNLRQVDIFGDSDGVTPLLKAGGETIAYQKPHGKGVICVLGFLPPLIKDVNDAACFGRLLDRVLGALGGPRPIRCDAPEIDVAIHDSVQEPLAVGADADASAGTGAGAGSDAVKAAKYRAIAFAANPTPEEKEGYITIQGAREISDIWAGGALRCDRDGGFRVKLSPYTVKIWGCVK